MSELKGLHIKQIGIIVRDIEKKVATYAECFGFEKPSIHLTDARDTARTEYRGKPSDARAKLAFFEFPNIEVELIEPDDQDSTWKEYLDKNGEGIHHIAFVINGMERVVSNLQKSEMSLVQKGEYIGGRYAYMDGKDPLGIILELLEND